MDSMEELNIPEMETVEIICEKEHLLDSMWLFRNIPWSNYDGKNAKVFFKDLIELFYIDMNGFDTSTCEIKSLKFDNVIILAIHGFGGNSYNFTFKLGEEKVGHSYDIERFGFSKEEVKDRFIKQLNRKLKGLKSQVKRDEANIQIAKKL